MNGTEIRQDEATPVANELKPDNSKAESEIPELNSETQAKYRAAF
jgi:hypothetical protein